METPNLGSGLIRVRASNPTHLKAAAAAAVALVRPAAALLSLARVEFYFTFVLTIVCVCVCLGVCAADSEHCVRACVRELHAIAMHCNCLSIRLQRRCRRNRSNNGPCDNNSQNNTSINDDKILMKRTHCSVETSFRRERDRERRL